LGAEKSDSIFGRTTAAGAREGAILIRETGGARIRFVRIGPAIPERKSKLRIGGEEIVEFRAARNE
jgi:hypothetical protein